MKEIKKILLLFGLVFSTFSCTEEFLEVAPKDKLSASVFFKTPADAVLASNGIYNTLYGQIGAYWDECDMYTDNATYTFGNAGKVFGNGTVNPSSERISNFWTEFYKRVRATNVFLVNIEDVTGDPDLVTRLTAEVRFIRAMSYMFLTFNWGDVPLVLEPLSLETSKQPRNAQADVLAVIHADLDFAIANLPWSQDDSGRVTKGAAMAYKARAYLYAGDHNSAAKAAKDLMDSAAGYDLYPDLGTLWWPENEHNEEVIFDLEYTEGAARPNVHRYNITFSPPSLSGWTAVAPTQAFINSFEGSDGLPIDESEVYDAANPYENRDPRFYKFILYNGADIFGHAITTDPSASNPDRIGGGNSTTSGYWIRKLYTPDYVPGNGWSSHQNTVFMRFAEVLLTYAEAQNEDVGPDVSVYDAINRVRDRAGMPDLPANLGQNEMRERIRNERRIELCFENSRLYDIRRWRIAEDVLNGTTQGRDFDGNIFDVESRVFDAGKNYLWPIPQSEIDLIGPDILTQNPGFQ